MNARLVAEKVAAETTRRIGIFWGESFPFYYVAEYPKSGGTWLARMLADYLQIPFPQYSLLPIACSAVIQTFGRFHPGLRRVLYLHRDGRDVMTSLYYDRLRIARHSQRPGRQRIAKRYEELFGKNYDPRDVVRHLPRFIEHEFRNPGRGTPLGWPDHVDDWLLLDSEHVVSLSYEDLLDDGVGTLGRALRRVTGEEPDRWRLETTVEKMSMLRQTGRRPGESDSTRHIRKGVAEDWRNHFSREAAEVFDALAGETLVRLGYESDRGWIDRYRFVES